MTETTNKTGELKFVGNFKMGGPSQPYYPYFECIDCGQQYPDLGPGVSCNYELIGMLCPWCRPDSKPWTNGRGM
jgi:uncharacterized protein CbrC (UPF0167 family)